MYECKAAGTKEKDKCELFITEGLSAARGLAKSRDRKYQAILPLRGKILNTAKLGLEVVVENKEISSLFALLGCGVEGVNFKLEDLRYNKIIISSDQDPDGMHIRALVLSTQFLKFTPELISNGKIYIVNTPLYIQDGNFIYNENDKLFDKSRSFSRKKGLGSLSDEETREFFLYLAKIDI